MTPEGHDTPEIFDGAHQQLIVQIIDAHLSVGRGDRGSARALRPAVEAISLLDPAPAAVLVTGDLTDNGSSREYERVRELIEPLDMPVHPIPGNHDDRDAMRAAFADHGLVAGTGRFVQYAVRCGRARVILCDTSEPGRADGRLCAERLGWLEARLSEEKGTPSLLAMHHPPLPTGIRDFDRIGLPAEDRANLAELVRRPSGVERIVAGHIHRVIFGELAGCTVFVCPSVHLQALLDLSPRGRLALIPEPPGFAVHVHGADETPISHVQPIGDYGAPLDD